jgi:hypothetical protein
MSGFEPCPYCKTDKAQRIRFTPWGGVIGPALLSLVKCAGCGGHFNGRSGRCVKGAIKLYTLTMLMALVVLMAFIMYSFAGSPKKPSNSNGGVRGGAVSTVSMIDAASV